MYTYISYTFLLLNILFIRFAYLLFNKFPWPRSITTNEIYLINEISLMKEPGGFLPERISHIIEKAIRDKITPTYIWRLMIFFNDSINIPFCTLYKDVFFLILFFLYLIIKKKYLICACVYWFIMVLQVI